MDAHQLLRSVHTRARKGRWGIGTAAGYLSSVQGCFNGGACPADAFSRASAEDWAKALKEAESRLTYCSKGMRVIKDSVRTSNLTAGSIMDFECVITTTRRDRDGDVLETKGAQPDLSMPLLWQHMPFDPIGKLVAITKHTPKMLCGRFAIADLPLGRDAATLIDFGGLRISHGFQPLDAEPLGEEHLSQSELLAIGELGPVGWHILKFIIMETSVVSVPSNVDAIITLFRRDKLHAPIVKAWAQKMFDDRQVIVPGAQFTDDVRLRGKDATPLHDVQINLQTGLVQITAPKPEEKSCTCHTGLKFNDNHDPHSGEFSSGAGEAHQEDSDPEPVLGNEPIHDVDHKLVNKTAEWMPKLTEGEQQSIKKYCAEHDCQWINMSLRQCPDGSCLDEKTKKEYGEIASAIDKFGSLKEPITVYRGINLNRADMGKLLTQVRDYRKTGQEIEFHGVISTSISSGAAFNFSPNEQSPIFRIKAKTGAYLKPLSGYPEECEFVQKNNTRYKVTGYRTMRFYGTDKRPVIDLEETSTGKGFGGVLRTKRVGGDRDNRFCLTSLDEMVAVDDTKGVKLNINHDPHNGEFSSGDGGSMTAVSPNTQEGTTYTDAEKALHGERHTAMAGIFDNVDKKIGLNGKRSDGIGDWSDGAEDTIVNHYPKGADYDKVRYAAALKGIAADQKAVLAFKADDSGKDMLWSLSFKGGADQARQALDKHGIQFRSLIKEGAGTRAEIVDIGTEHADKIHALQKELGDGVQVKYTAGSGEFIGGETRSAGREAYQRVIKDYEARHGSGAQYRYARRQRSDVRGNARVKGLSIKSGGIDSDAASPYGCCPHCGAPGIARERCLDGNDTCAKGHIYKSSEAIMSISSKGARMSLVNKCHLKAACQLLTAAHDHPDSTEQHKAFSARAFHHVKSVMSDADDNPDDNDDNSDDSIDPDMDDHNNIPDETSHAPAGQKLSAETMGHLQHACHLIKAAHGLPDSNEIHKAMYSRAYKHVKCVMDKDYGDDGSSIDGSMMAGHQPQEKLSDAEVLERALQVAMGDALPPDELAAFHKRFKSLLDVSEAQECVEANNRVLAALQLF